MNTPVILTTSEWQARSAAHRARVGQYTQPRRERRSRGAVHPVYDFLFQYYSYSAGKLEAWHPAPHEQLVDSPQARACLDGTAYDVHDGVIRRDISALTTAERDTFTQVVQLLRATQGRAPNFGCYGMHEWAMVYGGHDVRHAQITPLRLSQQEINTLVESRPVACSHFDAFRFFAPDAKPFNRVPLAWASRYDAEQPGCIHANMDLYRWAYTVMPWIGSDLLWHCFALAVDLRVLDMQASPYDLSAMGFPPVRIETAEGRDEYQQRQRELSARGSTLRSTLIATLDGLLL
ncbi:hypothetical protein [Gemmatimonas phototrophica]|uniref:3-methyladenine DNA glycosylase n=1 Tax=Gemmatimonas phototrophica TaxID=1379270 RepID=A0A143BP33_9BACT|nr:hypothetical protein [Gemmatimonas phototrophica]AMW06383.1 hypothetical protein GEMMAAP_19515 [Gemmatimonas phototrophica]